jgi:two-component system cell cycle response regulator
VDNQEKTDTQREMLFQKRIAELGFQRHQLPWNMGEMPSFNLPFNETKYASELEFETDAQTHEESERRVLMDLISNTYNFRTFYKRLHYELCRARRYKRTLSLMLVGIDRLDLIRDQFGEEAKEALIRSAAKIVMSGIRDVDLPGRCREDVFGVILPETPVEGVEVAAERIRTKLEQHSIAHNWSTISMTATIGAANFPAGAQNLDELFAHAAEALLNGMERGGYAIVFGG